MKIQDILQVMQEDDLTKEMVVVESCEDVNTEYAGLFVVYDPVAKAGEALSLIEEMDNELKDKMVGLLNTNPQVLFKALRGDNDSYTNMFVEQAGGHEAFLAMFEDDEFMKTAPSEEGNVKIQPVMGAAPVVMPDEMTETDFDMFDGDVTEAAGSGTMEELVARVEGVTEKIEALNSSLTTPLVNATELLTAAYSRLCNKEETMSERLCGLENLFNPDGTFKGFSEDNIEAIARDVKRMDERIALGSLDPNEILTEDELIKATECIEDFGPNIFKQFVLSICKQVENDADRVYVSGLIGRFLEYVKENV